MNEKEKDARERAALLLLKQCVFVTGVCKERLCVGTTSSRATMMDGFMPLETFAFCSNPT